MSRKQSEKDIDIKNYVLRFRAVNRDIFEAIRSGRKKVETRAATSRYRKIKAGDGVKLVCGKDRFTKQIKGAKIFRSISGLLREYEIEDIDPAAATEKDISNMCYSFPGYRDKIKKYGIIAIELK